MEFFDPEFLGPIMPLVKVSSHPLEPAAVAQRLPPGSFVGCAAKELPIHKALHQQNRMTVVLLPIVGHALQTQAQAAGSQVGPLLPVGQNDESAVLDRKSTRLNFSHLVIS